MPSPSDRLRDLVRRAADMIGDALSPEARGQCAWLREAADALASRPRNCDLFDNWEDAWQSWYPKAPRGIVEPSGMYDAFNAWLFSEADDPHLDTAKGGAE